MGKIKWLVLTPIIILLIIFSYIYTLKLSKKNTATLPVSTSMKSPKAKKSKVSDEIPRNVLKSLNSYNESADSQDKDLRKFPYPYNAMLAISSDIDDTTLEEFKTYHEFLNTKEQTPYGQGLGLDIGDSMWMFMGDNSKSKVDKHGNGVDNIMTFYKGTDNAQKHNADDIVHYINAGWIDSLHTFGDFSTDNEKGSKFNRKLAIEGWNGLKSINFKPTVWINHGDRANIQNFGASGTSKFMNYQQGDNPKSPYYHTDLTIGNGIKYVWNSIADYNFGHEYPLYELSLRDGRKVWGFFRYTNNLVNGKIDWTWTPKDLYRQLTQSNLDSIVKNKQYSIVTQHFGVDAENLFSTENIKALKMLKDYEISGKVLVAKTSRLLNYANIHKNILYDKVTEEGKTYINISCISDPIFAKYVPTLNDIRGITFYCDDPENTILLLNKNEIDPNEIQVNPKDETGRASISIKWFKPDYSDYGK